jgi:hypothetical protein
LKIYLTGRGHKSAARLRLTTKDGRPVPRVAPISGGRARCQWPPVVTVPRGLPSPLIAAPDNIEEAAAHSTFPLPPFSRAPRSSAPHGPLLHPPSPIAVEPPLSSRTGPKGVPLHCAPPAPRACP